MAERTSEIKAIIKRELCTTTHNAEKQFSVNNSKLTVVSREENGRDKARAYMNEYYNTPNPKYPYWNSKGGNCANYVSQCLTAGGVKQTLEWYMKDGNLWDEIKSHLWDKGKYNVSDGKKYTSSWSSASMQYDYFSNPNNGYINGEVIHVTTESELNEVQTGDLIYWDWEGDGKVNHATIVYDVIEKDGILYSGNTKSRKNAKVSQYLEDAEGGIYIIRMKDEVFQ